MSGFVGWQDYQGAGEGFGVGSAEDVNALNKALNAGQDINAPAVAAGEGFALRVESLERLLRSTTFRMQHVRLWRGLSKLPAYNTVEEHNILSSYGSDGVNGFISEGGLPNEDDSTYERKYDVIKYLGTTRKVSHVMSLVKPAHGNVIAQEAVNGSMHLLRMLEKALFEGDSSLSGVQFDGFAKLMTDDAPAANIIDLRGKPLTEDDLIDASLTCSDAPNYGTPTDLYLNPRNHSDLIKTFFPKARYDSFAKPSDGMVGLDVSGFVSPAGRVNFQPDTFITDGGGAVGPAGPSALRPGTPTISTGATTPVEATGQFAADDAGAYFYEVIAVNADGKSAPVSLAGAVTVAAGDKVTFGVTPDGGSPLPEYYEIYRTTVGGADGTERLILRVANAAGAGEQTINDLNANLPGTTKAFLFQQNLESMSFKQLAPLVKIPLATIDTSIRFMMLLYGVPVLYTPGKNVMFKNVGRAPGSVS